MSEVREFVIEGNLSDPIVAEAMDRAVASNLKFIINQTASGLRLRVFGGMRKDSVAQLSQLGFTPKEDKMCDFAKADPSKLFLSIESFAAMQSRVSPRRDLLLDLLEDYESDPSSILTALIAYFRAAIPAAIYDHFFRVKHRPDVSGVEFKKAILYLVVSEYPLLEQGFNHEPAFIKIFDIIYKENMDVVFPGDLDYK